MKIAEFYSAGRKLSGSRQISDRDNHRPHFNGRTLTRALTFATAADTPSAYSLRRSVWEGCSVAFTMVLDLSGYMSSSKTFSCRRSQSTVHASQSTISSENRNVCQIWTILPRERTPGRGPSRGLYSDTFRPTKAH